MEHLKCGQYTQGTEFYTALNLDLFKLKQPPVASGTLLDGIAPDCKIQEGRGHARLAPRGIFSTEHGA